MAQSRSPSLLRERTNVKERLGKYELLRIPTLTPGQTLGICPKAPQRRMLPRLMGLLRSLDIKCQFKGHWMHSRPGMQKASAQAHASVPSNTESRCTCLEHPLSIYPSPAPPQATSLLLGLPHARSWGPPAICSIPALNCVLIVLNEQLQLEKQAGRLQTLR